MLVEAIMISSAFLLILTLLREKPRVPPSAAATAPRLRFWASLKHLFCTCNFILIFFSSSLIMGAHATLTGISEQLFDVFGYRDAPLFSSIATSLIYCSGFASSFVFGWIADKTKKLKALYFITGVLSTAALGLLSLFLGR